MRTSLKFSRAAMADHVCDTTTWNMWSIIRRIRTHIGGVRVASKGAGLVCQLERSMVVRWQISPCTWSITITTIEPLKCSEKKNIQINNKLAAWQGAWPGSFFVAVVHTRIWHHYAWYECHPIAVALTNHVHFPLFASFQGFWYAVEMFDDKYGRPRLQYCGELYAKHYNDKNNTYWRCASHGKGCRARISTRSINGHELTNKPGHKVIHQNHWVEPHYWSTTKSTTMPTKNTKHTKAPTTH